MKAFSGDKAFLSNFWPCSVTYDGVSYPSVEHAYVAAKTTDLAMRERIRAQPTAGAAKRLGRKLALRSEWDDTFKLTVMGELLLQKFSDPALAKMLAETGDEPLVETNSWGDTFWGVCNGVGQNYLGTLLMLIREEKARQS